MNNSLENMKRINPDKCIVCFDFDNTIAACDVFDSMLPRFSKNNLWMRLEKEWKKGKIGSKACLEGQMKGMSLTKDELDKHLKGIRLAPHFKKLIQYLGAKKVKTIVLSDNFDYILERILRQHKINNLKVYSNKLRFWRDKLIPRFPFRSKKCLACAHCKTKNLLANVGQKSMIIYIGDGRSDICPAQYADLVFAKDELLRFHKDRQLACFAYESLKDVYDYFRMSFV